MFKYKKTPQERAAAKLLRDKGWHVSEPPCPLCHGFGTMGKVVTEIESGMSTLGWSTESCPNGCPVPAMYYAAQT